MGAVARIGIEAQLRSGLKSARTSSEKSCGCSQAAKCPPFLSLYIRAAEMPVFVNQKSVMLSRTSSRVRPVEQGYLQLNIENNCNATS
jgi:hypothetical protein